MESEQDLLFPAFQKYYSALSSLERFKKDNSFFDNMSSLDTFFAEYRNVTFVLKKSLKHTQYFDLYETMCEKHLSCLKWFKDTRNIITKEHPFEIEKKIDVTVYKPWGSFDVSSKTFSVTNDQPLSSLIDQTKKYLIPFSPVEVFFSARFSFYEKNTSINLFERIPAGLKVMYEFLTEIYQRVPEKTSLTEEVKKQINKNMFLSCPLDRILVNDYVYYPKTDSFDEVGRWSFSIGHSFGDKTVPRTPMEYWLQYYEQFGKTNFDRFVALHIAMRTKEEIVPAFMLVFQDNTYEIDAFNSDNKTTLYRKIHETSLQILNDNVKEVFFEYSILSTPYSPSIISMTAKERQQHAKEEWLVLVKIDDKLDVEEYDFYVPGLTCPGYIKSQLEMGRRKELYYAAANMQPIIKAFNQKANKQQVLQSPFK
ncbi:MAG: hypothetical protein PUC15_02895 [Lentisphaeria bacterium]|nr:hypothetical protein [Lentisphaeria bacterium]